MIQDLDSLQPISIFLLHRKKASPTVMHLHRLHRKKAPPVAMLFYSHGRCLLLLIGVSVLVLLTAAFSLRNIDKHSHAANNTTAPLGPNNIHESYHDDAKSFLWNHKDYEKMAELYQLDSEKRAQMKELRQLLRDIHHWKNDPFEAYRFLKEYQFDVEKAATKFRDMVAWRVSTDADSFMDNYGEPPDIFHTMPFFLLKGMDKDGDPIYVWRLGQLDIPGFLDRVGEAGMKAYYQFTQEMIYTRDHGILDEWNWQRKYYEPLKKGKRFKELTLLVDLEHMNTKQFRKQAFSFLKYAGKIGGNSSYDD